MHTIIHVYVMHVYSHGKSHHHILSRGWARPSLCISVPFLRLGDRKTGVFRMGRVKDNHSLSAPNLNTVEIANKQASYQVRERQG